MSNDSLHSTPASARSGDTAAKLRSVRGVPSSGVGDLIFSKLCSGAAWFVVILFVLLVAILFWKSLLSFKTNGPSLFTGRIWDPEPSHRIFGGLAFIFGTVATSVIAMIVAVPLGIGTAAYLSEIAPPRIRKTGAFFVEMLAAVPSVVYGFWGLFVLAPLMQSIFTALGGPNQGGIGIISAGIILSIMIVPYVASVSFDVCQAVPRSQREAALALSATRWQMIWGVVLPYARPGIIGASFLALGRAIGETMAVTMLIGNRTHISLSPFATGNSIASVIANEFTEATYDLYLSALVELGLVLLLVSVAFNSVARILIWKMNHPNRPLTFIGKWLNARKQRRALESRLPSDSIGGDNHFLLSPPEPTDFSRNRHWAQRVNRLMTAVLGGCLIITTGALFLIMGYLLSKGIRALNWEFFVNLPKPVGKTGGGMSNAIVGSCMMVGIASLIAVPIGLLAAIFLAEFRSERLGPVVRFIGEMLGGVPSIVIGIFAYYLLVRSMGHFSGWAGAFALSVMMLPIIMRASEEAIRLVPNVLRQASFALGASRWQTVARVTLPAALPAIITAIFLGIARVAGETAPLLLTAFSNSFWPDSPNDATPSVPVYIFNYAMSPYEDWNRQAWAAAFMLIVFVLFLNFGVRLMAGKRIVSASRAD